MIGFPTGGVSFVLGACALPAASYVVPSGITSGAPLPAAGEVPPTGTATLPDTDTAPLDMNMSPDERALVREGVAARRAAAVSDTQRGSVKLFDSPANEGAGQMYYL